MTIHPRHPSTLLASRRSSTGFMALLAGITALAPFSLQIFLPALPAIQASFAVTPGIVQLALSLTKAIEKQPDFADAYNARGLTYLLKCDYARTRSDLQRAVELDPYGDTGASAKENLELLGPQ